MVNRYQTSSGSPEHLRHDPCRTMPTHLTNRLDPTVFIVDDEPTTRRSFTALVASLSLKWEEFASGEEMLRTVAPERPGCAIVDYCLEGMNGLELHRRLVDAGCRIPVILIGGYLDVRTTARALEGGGFRVVQKPCGHEEMASTVREAIDHDDVCRGSRFFRVDFEHRLRSLDSREQVTLECILAGQSNKAIERKLGLSRRTVERIRSSILGKMGSLSFVELSAAIGEARATGALRRHVPAPRRLSPGQSEWAAGNATDAARSMGSFETRERSASDVGSNERVAENIAAALRCLQTVEDGHRLPNEDASSLRDAKALLSAAIGMVRQT
jgi:two-component system, LuxR family, response regulator FixJ